MHDNTALPSLPLMFCFGNVSVYKCVAFPSLSFICKENSITKSFLHPLLFCFNHLLQFLGKDSPSFSPHLVVIQHLLWCPSPPVIFGWCPHLNLQRENTQKTQIKISPPTFLIDTPRLATCHPPASSWSMDLLWSERALIYN